MTLGSLLLGFLVSVSGTVASPGHGDDPVRHGDPGPFCGTDLSSGQARANLARFAADRDSGLLAAWQAAAKSSEIHDIGDRRSFNVSEGGWVAREFELRDENATYRLWIAVDDLGFVSQDEIAGLQEAMLRSTPSTSVDPASGILVNNRNLLGDMPNVDGDGLLDILMYDMKAGDGPGTVVLGYVSSTDLLVTLPDGQGNRRDVLYLDANEGSANITRLASVAAHELTHLIHFGYLDGKFEETFIMEGLAEYSMVFNGFHTRGANYLQSVAELAVPLFQWRTEPSGGGPNAWDYQRASLFFSYIGQRIGPVETGRILRAPGQGGLQGAFGVDAILKDAGLSLAAVVADFHTANRFNDRSLDPAFGYEATSRSLVSTVATRSLGSNGQLNTTLPLYGGAVEFFDFAEVDFLEFRFDTPTAVPAVQDLLRRRMRGRAVFEAYDGSRTWEDLAPTDEPFQFRGPFRTIRLVLANVTGTVDTPTSFVFDGHWTAAPAGTATDPVAAGPTDFTLGAAYPNPFAGVTNLPIRVDRPGHVRVTVYDLLGRLVSIPVDQVLTAGSREIVLDGSMWNPGTYFVLLETQSGRATRSVTVLRQGVFTP